MSNITTTNTYRPINESFRQMNQEEGYPSENLTEPLPSAKKIYTTQVLNYRPEHSPHIFPMEIDITANFVHAISNELFHPTSFIFLEEHWKAYFNLQQYEISVSDINQLDNGTLNRVTKEFKTTLSLPNDPDKITSKILTIPKGLSVNKLHQMILKLGLNFLANITAQFKQICDEEVKKSYRIIIRNEPIRNAFLLPDDNGSLQHENCRLPRLIEIVCHFVTSSFFCDANGKLETFRYKIDQGSFACCDFEGNSKLIISGPFRAEGFRTELVDMHVFVKSKMLAVQEIV